MINAILILCWVEILLGIFGVLLLVPWVNAIDTLHNHSEYISREEKDALAKKEKILGIALSVIGTLIGFCVLAIIILAFLV